MYKNLFVGVFALCLINAQGLQGIKEKIAEVEKEIRDNAALIEITTPENFKGERQDLVKEFSLKRKREEITILGVKGFKDGDTWIKFGSIGNDVDVINMKMGKYKNKVTSESKFGKRVASREYQFQVSVDGEITSCGCITKTTRKYAVPLLEYLDKEKITYRIGNERKQCK